MWFIYCMACTILKFYTYMTRLTTLSERRNSPLRRSSLSAKLSATFLIDQHPKSPCSPATSNTFTSLFTRDMINIHTLFKKRHLTVNERLMNIYRGTDRSVLEVLVRSFHVVHFYCTFHSRFLCCLISGT